MSHKKPNQRIHTHSQRAAKTTEQDTARTSSESLSSVVETAGSSWKLIGAAAGFCGAAVYLLSTDSGRKIRATIQRRLSDLYGQASDQVSSGYSSIRDSIRGMTSSESVSEESDFDSKVRELQAKFRLVV